MRGLGNRSSTGVVDTPIKIRPHRIVREAFFPQSRRQRGNVAGGMLFHALQDIHQIDVRIDSLQPAGCDQALKHADVLGPELGLNRP